MAFSYSHTGVSGREPGTGAGAGHCTGRSALKGLVTSVIFNGVVNCDVSLLECSYLIIKCKKSFFSLIR